MNSKSGWKPWKPALRSKSESEEASGPWRPTRRQVLWAVGMVVALLTTALLIINLRPEIWKSLLEERNLTLIAIGVSVAAIIVLLAIGGATRSWTGFRGKTVWDWLQLLSALAIPVVLAAAGLWFTAQQDQRQQRTETQRAEAERELAEQRAQDEALQAYLDQMSTLLLEKDLRASDEDSAVRTLARARTVTVLGRVDPSHKSAVIQFLAEATLIQRDEGRKPVISLMGADLNGANMGELDLSGAHLMRADLRDAFLFRTDLSDAQLYSADLSDAYLSWANLGDVDLGAADLNGANLQVAYLGGAYLRLADLEKANLNAANLSDANLFGAQLIEANLLDANLSGANLRGAPLLRANLRDANLQGARETTPAQLRDAKTLEDATMPNGQKYEEWLKDR